MPTGLTSSLHDSDEEMHGASFGEEICGKSSPDYQNYLRDTFFLSDLLSLLETLSF